MKNHSKPLFILLLTLLAALCLSVFALAAPAEEAAAPASEEAEAPLSEQFSDLSYSENEVSLTYMIDRGFIAGYSDGCFRPGRAYTRLELAKLVAALCELETASGYKSSFTDCSLAGDDAAAIDAAVSNGLMTGRSAQSFDPYGTVLKAEMLGTLEQVAAYLELEGFYEHADGFTAWRTDYTVCTADSAMQAAYPLALALVLREEAEIKAAETEAAAEAVAELTGKDGAASGEPSAEADTAATATDAETETETAAEETTAEETAKRPSGEPSNEAAATPAPTAAAAPAAATDTTPPAGVTAPAPAAQPTAAPAATAAPETEDEADGLRNDIKDKYADIRDSIVAFLRGLFGG